MTAVPATGCPHFACLGKLWDVAWNRMIGAFKIGESNTDAVTSSFRGVPLVTIHGDIDHASVRGLTPRMLEGLALPGERLVFELTDCPYLDSSGIGLFLGLLFEVAETGWLGAVGANEALSRVFNLTGLSSRSNFRTWADLEELRVFLEE
jgi:anti-sigma B factor antagonist